jgi:asparagine synthetase B (glutamine-hydrolysing)
MGPIDQIAANYLAPATTTIDGRSFPTNCAVSQAIVSRGETTIHTAYPGEVPIYYTLTDRGLYWDEQKYLLPGTPDRLDPGTAIIWNPLDCTLLRTAGFPRPEIVAPVSQEAAIGQYLAHLKQSVQRQLGNHKKVAIAQSGGVDSLLIAWALKELGIQPVTLTVCTEPQDLDWVAAQQAMSWLGFDSIPIRIQADQLPALLREAVLRIEHTESLKIRMAIGNILMARKCQELGIEAIFTGNGQDDIFANGTLIAASLKQYTTGTLSERWRDARRTSTAFAPGHLKMFSATFRGYGIHVLQPYYDHDFMSWAFSQPVEVLPVRYDKHFVRQVLGKVMRGPWCDKRHSIGYVSGAGLAKRSPMFAAYAHLFEPRSLNQHVREFRKLSLPDRRKAFEDLGR